jgi:hypothetical protein
MLNKDGSKQDVKQFQEDFDKLHEGVIENEPEVKPEKSTKPTKPTAVDVENYLKDNGISDGFELIFTELLIKNIKPEDYFSYTASRLRDMGRKLDNNK